MLPTSVDFICSTLIFLGPLQYHWAAWGSPAWCTGPGSGSATDPVASSRSKRKIRIQNQIWKNFEILIWQHQTEAKITYFYISCFFYNYVHLKKGIKKLSFYIKNINKKITKKKIICLKVPNIFFFNGFFKLHRER